MSAAEKFWLKDLTWDQRVAWCDWFERHGIDTDRVGQNWVLVDPAARRITWVDVERRADGSPVVGSKGFTQVERTLQLESPPLSPPRP